MLLISAALVVVLLALLHSILAELLVFCHTDKVQGFRPVGFPPFMGTPQMPMGIIRVCWHLLTVFALGMAAIIGRYGMLPQLDADDRFVIRTFAAIFLTSSLCIFVGTRARHIGWMALLAAAFLCWLGS